MRPRKAHGCANRVYITCTGIGKGVGCCGIYGEIRTIGRIIAQGYLHVQDLLTCTVIPGELHVVVVHRIIACNKYKGIVNAIAIYYYMIGIVHTAGGNNTFIRKGIKVPVNGLAIAAADSGRAYTGSTATIGIVEAGYSFTYILLAGCI